MTNNKESLTQYEVYVTDKGMKEFYSYLFRILGFKTLINDLLFASVDIRSKKSPVIIQNFLFSEKRKMVIAIASLLLPFQEAH